MEFIEAIFNHTFMLYAFLACLLAGVVSGVIGTYVVTRKITYLAGAIAHSVLGGMGIAHYFSVVYELPWLHPLYGAIVAAVVAAIIIALVSIRAKEREDTVIGAIWAIGMAVGILFIARTPGYNEELMSYLFGNILMVGQFDLLLIGILDAIVIIFVFIFYNQLQAVCFDEEFARIRGVRTNLIYLLLLIVTALTVVILVTVVGIILVIALLTLPAAIAGRFTRNLWQTMILSSSLAVIFSVTGLGLSYSTNLPSGPTIIIVAGFFYLLLIIFPHFFGGRETG